ncbi:hypothetical protein F5Y18DRAFT_431662 [Xylariaceae sp. FL1019]|nr:hypothetical protein F5Y18DRAFT_431662 [Xylariaceae sp. FL1019]
MGLRRRFEGSAMYQRRSAKTEALSPTTFTTAETSSVSWPDSKVLGMPFSRSANTKSDSDAGLIVMIVILVFLIMSSAAAYFLMRRYFAQQRAQIASRAIARRETLRGKESERV